MRHQELDLGGHYAVWVAVGKPDGILLQTGEGQDQAQVRLNLEEARWLLLDVKEYIARADASAVARKI